MKLRLMASVVGLLILISSAARAQVETEQTDPGQTDQVQADQDQPQQDQADQSQTDQPQYDQGQYDQPQANGPQAQPAQTDSTQKETGVGRISLIHGDVSTQRGDSGDWSTATLNQPVVPGDKVATSDGGRAEVQLDYANILRIDQRTEANITGLTKSQIQIQLARGLANYSVLKDSEADVEIDAPNLSVHPSRGDGSFRIMVYSDDQAEVLVRKGEAVISTPRGSTHVRAGQSIMVRGSGNDTQYKVADAAARDDFDRWNSDRDNMIRNAQSWSRTNRYYVGSEDLDSHGRWQSVPDYGDVWVPAVANDWAPYRDGRWVWEPYWGWTWVSYESWGWAPYHYGRWFMYDNSWVWWPGYSYGYRSYYRPIWAPAYVSFFGFGGGVGVGFGFGSVGWLPIGPCDGFYPWWGGYRSRFNVVNIYNVHNYNYRNGGYPPLRRGDRYSNLRLASVNDRVRRGVSTVDAHDFGRGRASIRPVSAGVFRNGRMVAGNLPVVPGRESLLAGNRRATPPSVARGGQSQHFFSNNHSVAARPQSFDREAAQVHNAIQRDGHFTPIGGNRTVGNEANRSFTQGRTAQYPGGMKPSAGRPLDRPSQAPNSGSSQAWRRLGGPDQRPNVPSAGTGVSNSGARPERGGANTDWRRAPTSGSQGSRGSGPFNNGNSSGRVSNPVDRPTNRPTSQGNGNQDWRRMDRPSSAPRSSGPTEAPASRDRNQRESSAPTQDRGNDWRRAPADRPGSYGGSNPRTSAPTSQRDSGNWRQSAPRDSGREYSRPQLDMRQPIVTPRYSGPSSSGGYRGNGGYSSPRSAPSGGGYSAPRGGSYGGGHSAPSGGGGGHSAPSHGGGGHSSGGGGGSHHGR